MREFEIKEGLNKKLIKISKKDRSLFNAIIKKIDEIINTDSIEHYKNLRYDLKDFKRVHIGYFVLIFSYNKEKDFISFEDFDHHNNVYKKD